MIISGTDAGETLTGTIDDDTITALGGNDTVHAGDGNDAVDGGAGSDALYGESGNDILDGGIGGDTLVGGAGDDTYYVENTYDAVVEAANSGRDRVYAHLNYTLGANVENLTLIGTGSYSAAGNAGNNMIVGNRGNNRLDGGTGVDILLGGSGNDTYVVRNSADTVVEYGGEGVDAVQADISFVLTEDVENLTLTGAGNRLATGNRLANQLTGNSGANVLRGLDGNDVINGGLGADSLYGGAGDDTFWVDNAGDKVFDYTGQGTDTVMASVSYGLSGTAIENLTLTGTGDINAQGNGLDNLLTGNSGNNVLSGGGGTDTLIGGKGNDTYRIDDLSDIIVELANGGTDTVLTALSFSLANTELENLTLSGAGNVNGTGNAVDNVLTGNAGNNVLNGGAGTGDRVIENDGEGHDTVMASVSWSLTGRANFIEDLVLTGSGNINGTGNHLGNVITGNSGDNVLNGGYPDRQ